MIQIKDTFKSLTRRSRAKYLGDYRTHLRLEDRLHIVKGFCHILFPSVEICSYFKRNDWNLKELNQGILSYFGHIQNYL